MTPGTAITFFYYPDLSAVIPFYEQTLGFELVLDQGTARIYRIAPNCHFGIVDGNKGHLRHQPRSAALLTLVVADVAAWHAKLTAAPACPGWGRCCAARRSSISSSRTRPATRSRCSASTNPRWRPCSRSRLARPKHCFPLCHAAAARKLLPCNRRWSV